MSPLHYGVFWGVALFAAAQLALWSTPGWAQARGQCAACHERLPGASGAGHGFTAWRGSRHGAVGVGCEACHGGNASTPDREAAHRGMRRSSDPESPVYFRRIPDTCGRCHAAELAYFRSSIHFARLRSDGRGPNCVTCHGSMATSLLAPEQVLRTCSACHAADGVAAPERARESAQVLALVRVENILYDIVAAAAEGGSSGAGRARALLVQAQRHLDAAAEVWHGFRVDSASQRLGAAREDIVAAWVALGHRRPREGRLGRAPGPERP
ncbi:MAG: hypothetical protein HY705_04885 [Gemmatimonadetes bacterium]|nr:hypothetical protein [Gemmatimonadota bacterium]